MRHSFFILTSGIILLSFTAVISKVIVWPVLITVFARSGLAFLFLLVILLYKKEDIRIPINILLKAIIGGVFLAIHWWTYFKAVEIAGVAIGLCSLFTFPIITAIIEPFILKKKIKTHIYFCSSITLIGITILVWDNTVDQMIVSGIIIGIISAMAYTTRNLISKPLIKVVSGTQLMMVQSIVSFLFFFIITLYNGFNWTTLDIALNQLLLVLLLGIVFTGIAHTLFLKSLKYYSVSFVSLCACIQPLLGTILGILIINEQPSFNIWFGGALILTAIGYTTSKEHT